jgi:hypothetical protein
MCKCTDTHMGKTVMLTGRKHWGPGTVVHDPGFVGLDGRHWLGVLIGVNQFHVSCVEVIDESKEP